MKSFFLIAGTSAWLIATACRDTTAPELSVISCYDNGDTLYQLSSAKPLYSQTSEPSEWADKKFIRVEVVHVENPDLQPVTLDLFFKRGNNRILLGSVSLFPSDNPGSFIIAARHHLEQKGELQLSLDRPKETKNKRDIIIQLRKLSGQ